MPQNAVHLCSVHEHVVLLRGKLSLKSAVIIHKFGGCYAQATTAKHTLLAQKASDNGKALVVLGSYSACMAHFDGI